MSCWGDFTLIDIESCKEIRPRGRKARALLAYLALHPGKAISRERVTGLLWGDRAEEQARASLRQALVELKQFSNSDPKLLIVDRESIALNPAVFSTDIDGLRAMAAEHDYAGLLAAIPEIGERLFANLDDVDADFDDWLAIERTRQLDQLCGLIDAAAADARAGGNVASARALEQRLQEIDPSFEPGADQTEANPLPPANDSAVRRPPARPPETDQPPRAGRRPWLAIALVLALGAGLFAWNYSGSMREAPPTTIAVLPFRDLSGRHDSYFADGIAEEIMAQLSRDPGQKVMGRTSAWSFRDQHLDARAIGRRLSVAYLVEGSVRSAGEQVRVDVSLVRAEDGSRVWTERFSGPLDDIFGMQDRIGEEISRRLKTGNSPAPSLATRGDAYALFLTARGLVRTREDAKIDAAVDLLRQAVRLDPSYAPTWASLGKALIHRGRQQPDALAEGRASPEAIAHIRRALALQPNLAEGHLALGMALGPGGPRKAHFERAAQLEPSNSEILNALALEYRFRGEYGRELDIWRRAVAVDPLWHRTYFNAAETAWNLGFRAEAERYARRYAADAQPRPFAPIMVPGDMAYRRGDFSTALATSKSATSIASGGRRFFGELAQSRAFRAMGYFDDARPIWPFYRVDDTMARMWRNEPPSLQEMAIVFRDPEVAWKDEANISFRLATLINAGRAAEAARLYDLRFSSPRDMTLKQPLGHATFVRHAALVALALRMSGREAESRELVANVDSQVRRVMTSGRVPAWYHALSAQLWAVAGRREAALTSLQQAVRLGWFYSRERDSFADIAIEPTFRSLRGDPRFERIRNAFNSHIQRERAQARL